MSVGLDCPNRKSGGEDFHLIRAFSSSKLSPARKGQLAGAEGIRDGGEEKRVGPETGPTRWYRSYCGRPVWSAVQALSSLTAG